MQNLDLPWTTFGRLRPLHTNAVIFAFVGNGFFAGGYYSHAAPPQGAHVLGHALQDPLLGLAAHHRLGRPDAALRHHDVQGVRRARVAHRPAITLIWVVFAINFFGTLAKRRERHLYVAIWFYIAS
jgi:cytochrome c oxidase cbb3-type subunit I/II